ncbi:MAG: hypothetical protein LC770_06370 [Acidobacteria bacterium]|nr:hypothetical protein [Acidobacteriota bacterium]
MEDLRIVEIDDGAGKKINVELEFEGDREGGALVINGINYHFERIKRERLVRDYKVDTDPDYYPQADANGYCYLIAPFSES